MSVLARVLLRTAAWLMPADRRDWLEAMRAESAYLPTREALRWSFGCLFTAFKERFAPMKTGDLRVSRWVMLVETFGCFGVITFACIQFASFLWNLSRLDWEFISKIYLTDPGETFVLTTMVLGAVVGLVGPVGLFLGLRFVVFGRALVSRTLGCTLLGALLVYAIVVTAGYFVGPPDFSTNSFMLLVVVFPIVGIVHLMYLARPAAQMEGPPAMA